jgi:hypothetical protein
MNHTLLWLAIATVSCCISVAAAPTRTSQCLPEKLCDAQETSPCKSGQSVRIVVEITNNNTESRFYAYCVMVDQLTQVTLVGCKLLHYQIITFLIASGFLNDTWNSTVQLHIGKSGGTYASSERRYFTDEVRSFIQSIYTIGEHCFRCLLHSTNKNELRKDKRSRNK